MCVEVQCIILLGLAPITLALAHLPIICFFDLSNSAVLLLISNVAAGPSDTYEESPAVKDSLFAKTGFSFANACIDASCLISSSL